VTAWYELMSSFAYVARDTVSGREIRNSVEAVTEQAAIAALLNRNLLVVTIQEKMTKKARTSGGKVPLMDLVIFTRQLATMIDCGPGHGPVPAGPGGTDEQQGDARRDSQMSAPGWRAATAPRKPCKSIPRCSIDFTFCMVAAGERGGLLLKSWLAWRPTSRARRGSAKKVKSAMMYPTVVTVVAILITGFLLVKVVPVFAEVFSTSARSCPRRRNT